MPAPSAPRSPRAPPILPRTRSLPPTPDLSSRPRQTSAFRDARVVRSRDPAALAPCDAVLDVGGIYDPATRRYDHHQRGFDETMKELGRSVKLSSAGLVYRHWGKEVIAARLGLVAPGAEAKSGDADAARLDEIFRRVYVGFVEALDAVDNGVDRHETASPARYDDATSLPARVGRLNPPWNAPAAGDGSPAAANADLDARFEVASALAGSEFMECVDRIGKVWLPARDVVRAALESREADTSEACGGRVVVLARPCPWKEHLTDLEEEMGLTAGKDGTNVLFVLFRDDREGKWRVQAVNEPGSFALRRGLPAAWRGLRDAELDAAAGAEPHGVEPGCVFVHAAGFIGGHETREGALAMAAAGVATDD